VGLAVLVRNFMVPALLTPVLLTRLSCNFIIYETNIHNGEGENDHGIHPIPPFQKSEIDSTAEGGNLKFMTKFDHGEFF